MSSIAAGLLGVKDHALYNASKMAVKGMVTSFATDFGREGRGVTVNGVAPGGLFGFLSSALFLAFRFSAFCFRSLFSYMESSVNLSPHQSTPPTTKLTPQRRNQVRHVRHKRLALHPGRKSRLASLKDRRHDGIALSAGPVRCAGGCGESCGVPV